MPNFKHINTASTCMLSISACIVSPVSSHEDVSSLIACSCVLTYDYMKEHDVTIEDIKNVINNPTAEDIVDRIYAFICEDIDKLRRKLEG